MTAYLVLRIAGEPSDTWAKPVCVDLGLEANVSDVLDTAVPDLGAIVEYAIAYAADEGAACIAPNMQWHRVPTAWVDRWQGIRAEGKVSS